MLVQFKYIQLKTRNETRACKKRKLAEPSNPKTGLVNARQLALRRGRLPAPGVCSRRMTFLDAVQCEQVA
jgi:hypothetical protein